VVPTVEPVEAKARPVSMVRGNSAGETKVEEDKTTKRVSFVLSLCIGSVLTTGSTRILIRLEDIRI